jgi:hypothetical protein
MRLLQVALSDFKGIEATLSWRRVNVLFGPNDAGKTNILEAVASAFGAADLTRPSGVGTTLPAITALLEMEHGEGDDAILDALFRWSHVPLIFPAARRHDARDPGATGPLLVAPARLRWAGREHGGRSFSIPATDADAGVNESEQLQATRLLLLQRALRAVRARVTDTATEADVTSLVGAALESRHLLFERGQVSLLCPTAEDCESHVVAAAERLAGENWQLDPVVGPIVRQIVDGPVDRQPLLRMLDRRELRPFDIVWAAAEGDEDADIESTLRREFDRWYAETSRLTGTARDLRRILARPGFPSELGDVLGPWLERILEETKIASNTTPSDRWLRHFPIDPLGPAKWVAELAHRVTEDANRLAAPIVRSSGELELDVLGPRYWIAENRRLYPGLWQPHRETATPLRDLGFGVRAWAAIAVIEGATQQRQSALQALEAIRSELTQTPQTASPTPKYEYGRRKRLLIVDEPEQHLHPRAQRDVAAWLAAGANERETLLATHALPFLDMPNEQTSYVLVTRDARGVTGGIDISDDMFDALEQVSVQAGLSGRAEALQTIRAVCLVEGLHDEMVLRHFYREDFARHRILVLPTRGARNVNAIIDAPWLSRMGLPLIILFDDVRASRVTSGRRPGGRDVAARAVWDLFANWKVSTCRTSSARCQRTASRGL